ncbi:High affinity cationic amino acid transporter 1-like Protein [Tribolium castaneum]|uniref:High affinity cationic amino acid transporter 1-like Protein n=1 Tax=Tribolium castaneum TaxID=7070 RepID=D6X156_TRICA|nr:PREDICTED: high affinity cationic amino acid transporter 1 isoform X1 [Tribolium castaneum]EFA09380.2 High affinity cationic amino acid transporter 1-like Protein [Tribolium castaneum]|eukprot:XP_008199283.1 PREDICTED: high affinity cationic amino acid transporter 1 isoform X1 [Tribolium castaneum]
MGTLETVWRVLTRKKILDPVSTERSELSRVLNTWDLTALGVGSTLGVGVYVLAGQVALKTAGPSVVLSFVIATIASVFAGLCYAEFGARTPRAGSAYIYSYVCVGEFVAFVIGWNLILEYVIGSASVARTLSNYLDALINDTLKDTFREIAPIDGISFMSTYFDFLAFGISILLAIALAFGLKESSIVNNIFTAINLFVVLFVVIAGATKANTDNWYLPANGTGTGDEGGFFPFGVEGMIKGAATCFYGFVGFDCIATTGEEVKNPKRAIPTAIIFSLFVIFLAYFGTSTVLTLMVPFYNEDYNAPLPHAFEMVGMSWAKWVVTIGGLFALCASLFGAMFPLPRIIYAMANDSLVFRFLGRVSSRFKTPVAGTLVAGVLTGLMAALFDVSQLINMMSIGTLMAYTIVAASVLLLRYEIDKGDIYEPLRALLDSEEVETYTENRNLDGTSEEIELMPGEITTTNVFKQIFNCGRHGFPSDVSERIVKFQVCLYCILCILIGVCAMHLKDWIRNDALWGIVVSGVVVGLAVLVLMSITTQPQSRKELPFKVPLVPLIPALSILINIYLMLMLDVNTWIRFGVWMLVGLPTYYFSIQTHSDARNESICSRDSVKPNGNLTSFTNHAYVNDETLPKIKPRAPEPPISNNIEATIAVLDLVLENEEANIDENLIERELSLGSASDASNVLREENVQAVVHCPDQSGDVETPTPEPDPASDEPPPMEEEADEPPPEAEDTPPVPPPPPPPPLEGVAIPRPHFRLSEINNVKLKSWDETKPLSPPVDYSRQNSMAPDNDGNLKFGSPQYKEFREYLTQTLQDGGYAPTPIIGINNKPVKTEPVFIENVVQDKIDRDDVKQKLTLFLERHNNNNNVKEDNLQINNIVEDFKEEYKKNSENVSSSGVKQRAKDDNDYERLRHKQNMNNVFKSIRLKKVDSFNESQ